MIKLVIPGPPIGKARPRVTKYGAYTPAKTVNYETLVKELFAVKYPDHSLLEGPLWIQIEAYIDVPKSYSKKKKQAIKDGQLFPTGKPDMDNILKIIGDALNGLAYRDDSQIIVASIRKQYDEGKPRAEIFLDQLI